MPDTGLADSGGRVRHPADCSCRVCKGVRTAGERRQAEAEETATVRAVARALVRMAALGSLSGPDALRNLVGHDDALRVLRAAGMSPEQAAAGWQAAEPVRRQASAQLNGGYAGDPDHDPRVTAVLQHGTDAELARIRAQVHAEYRQRAAEKAAGSPHAVLWRTRDGIPVVDGTAPQGVSLGPDGAPVQVSRVSESVPPLGSEG